jgi:hypothetical protein
MRLANFYLSQGRAQYASCCQSAKSNLARRLCKRWQKSFVKSSALEARFLGVFTAAAANEPDQEVVAHLLAVGLDTDANPGAEIEEMIRADILKAHSLPLAPLVTEAVLPIIRKIGRSC